jgi:transcriptional regulator GlxA family with amidase domain
MTKPPARPSIPPTAPLPPAIAKAVRHIQAHLEERLPLADVAAVAQLSVWRFCTVFRRHTGSSPHRYISALRVQRVQALMAQGVSPAVAASAAGFYDQSHLNRHFKHTLGMTAGQFMTRCRGETIVVAA